MPQHKEFGAAEPQSAVSTSRVPNDQLFSTNVQINSTSTLERCDRETSVRGCEILDDPAYGRQCGGARVTTTEVFQLRKRVLQMKYEFGASPSEWDTLTGWVMDVV